MEFKKQRLIVRQLLLCK